jgi:hypothetical protein
MTSGTVVSYWKRNEDEALLPATSAQLPVSEPELVSGPLYGRFVEHDAIPLVASVPVHDTLNGALYQFGAASYGREAVAVNPVGAVASRLIVTAFDAAPPTLVALHVYVVPVVSMRTTDVPHPVVDEIAESGSVTVQLTVTLLTYQPALPSVPLTTGVMTGGVVSQEDAVADTGIEVVRVVVPPPGLAPVAE